MVTPRRRLGDFGERLAARSLESAGMRIIAANVRMPAGEIDVVAEDGNEVVFVEVRTRRAAPGLAAESLTEVKLRRMWQCAMEYCETNAVNPERVRIDAVTVDLDATGRVSRVEHFRALDIPD
jgi:putative endonuclease